MIRSIFGKTKTLKKDHKPAGQRLNISAPSDFRIVQEGAGTASEILASAVDIKPGGSEVTPKAPPALDQKETATPGERAGE